MKANPSLHAWLACACLAISGAAGASDPEAVRSLQQRWAEVKYAAKGDAQQKQADVREQGHGQSPPGSA